VDLLDALIVNWCWTQFKMTPPVLVVVLGLSMIAIGWVTLFEIHRHEAYYYLHIVEDERRDRPSGASVMKKIQQTGLSSKSIKKGGHKRQSSSFKTKSVLDTPNWIFFIGATVVGLALSWFTLTSVPQIKSSLNPVKSF
jgi:hypothetical protein